MLWTADVFDNEQDSRCCKVTTESKTTCARYEGI
jgi:hypothetical protein